MKQFCTVCASIFLFCGSLCGIETIHDIPYSGLVLNKVELKGAVISDFHFANNQKFIRVAPGERFECHAQYEIDASELDSLHRYHLIFGLYGQGPQNAITSSIGLIDFEGSSFLELTAPEEKGIYEVRVSILEGLTYNRAKENWNQTATAKTILGIVVVE